MNFKVKIKFFFIWAAFAIGINLNCVQAQDPPRVRFATSMGDIVVQLDPARAPTTVENFLGYVRDKHYDGTIFHRVIDNFMIQGGGFTSEMHQKPTRPAIPLESTNGLTNDRYTIAMARVHSNPNSATAQFFINLADNKNLNSGDVEGQGYAVFGRVVEGVEVVDRIRALPTTQVGNHRNVPASPVIINSATASNDIAASNVAAAPQVRIGQSSSNASTAAPSRGAAREPARTKDSTAQSGGRLGSLNLGYAAINEQSIGGQVYMTAFYTNAASSKEAADNIREHRAKMCRESRQPLSSCEGQFSFLHCGVGWGAQVRRSTSINGSRIDSMGIGCGASSAQDALRLAVKECRSKNGRCLDVIPGQNSPLDFVLFKIGGVPIGLDGKNTAEFPEVSAEKVEYCMVVAASSESALVSGDNCKKTSIPSYLREVGVQVR